MASVLVVDDVDVVRMVLRRMLARAGHSVIEAGDAATARTLMKENRFDIVITDIWMPGEDSLNFIQEVKAAQPGLPVIAVTGGAPRAPVGFSFDAAFNAGADRILLKPIAMDELLENLAALLAAPTRHPPLTVGG